MFFLFTSRIAVLTAINGFIVVNACLVSFLGRPTKPVAWWGEGEKKILGGRDGVAGGTWMGCTKDGRLAFVTNVLEPHTLPSARTRGELPVRFLQVIYGLPWIIISSFS